MALGLCQTAFSVESTMVSHTLGGDCNSLTVEYKGINGYQPVALTEDQANPFFAEAPVGVHTVVKNCVVRMSFLVPAYNKLGVYDAGPTHTYAGRFNGTQYLYDNDSLFAYRVGWDLQDVLGIPSQFNGVSHPGPLFANYFGSDMTSVLPIQWTACKKVPQTVSMTVQIDLKAVSSKVNLAKLFFRNAHIRTATVACQPNWQLPDVISATPLAPVTVKDPKVKPDPGTVYNDPKGRFTGAVKYLLAHVKKDNIKATYAELLETLGKLKGQLLDEATDNGDLQAKSEGLVRQLSILEEYITEKMGKHEKREIKKSTKEMLEETLEVLSQDLSHSGPLSCGKSYAEAQREVVGKLGLSVTEESLAAIPLLLVRDQILTNPKIVFTFLLKFLSPALAEQVVFQGALAPVLGAASALAIAGFTAREIILIDKLVRISKMRGVLEELDLTSPGKNLEKSYAEDIDLCRIEGFQKYLKRLNSNKALCDGSLKEASKGRWKFMSPNANFKLKAARLQVVTMRDLVKAVKRQNHNSSRANKP